MNSTVKLLMFLFCLFFLKPLYGDTQCGGGAVGSGMAAQNTVLFVWAKTVDDPSVFPSWANALPSTLTDFYRVMSYNQHTVTTKVATKNGGFFVSDPGHTVSYYKNLWQPGQGYIGPFGIFVAEILAKVEAEYGANYFNDVNIISMMITDGGKGWYFPQYPDLNGSGVGYLGVKYTTGNGKIFDAEYGGINSEFAEGEKADEWLVCHEYGHFLGLVDLPKTLGTYSLMQDVKVNDPNEGVTPLSVKDVTDLGWLNMNDPTRVKTVTANTSVTLQPLRSPTGVVAAKVLFAANDPYGYFLIANHQRSTNIYDGTYPSDGLLIWHIEGISYTDIECAVGTDPIVNDFNKDHLGLPQSDPNYHGEGLASDFFNQSGQSQFTPWTNPNTDYVGSDPLPTNLAVTNITSNGNAMNFDVIYSFLSGTITVDSWWKNSLLITGNVTLNSGKTLTLLSGATAFLTGNTTLTLNPGATLYADGTLDIDRNVTVTGGGSIVKSGSGQVLVTYSASALASNNSRKLARGVNGNYHLVFETVGEICYERLTDSGAITEFHRLSNGVADGVKSSPCIYVRDNNILVVWQKNTGSSHDITFHKSTDYGVTWPTSNRKVIASGVGANSPLPVISSPGAGLLMVVYRTATNLSYRTSADNGNNWLAAAAVPSSGASGNSPTLAVTTSNAGYPRTALVNAATGGNGAIFYRYFIHEQGDTTGWAYNGTQPFLKNLSLVVPGSYTGHQNPSLAPSGDPSSKVLHVAWEATNSSGAQVVIHRLATDLYSWQTGTNAYRVITSVYGKLRQPSITGLSASNATLLYQDTISPTETDIFKISYSGNWGGATFISSGINPSVSVGNTNAKYVWTYGTAAPYEIKTSSETLSKTNGAPLSVLYHRSIAVIDTTTRNWLEVRLDKLAVKTKAGEEFAIPFAEAKEDANTLTPANAFTNLASSSITLPANAESLFVRCQVNGQGLSAIKSRANLINVEITLAKKNGATLKLPVITTSSESLPETKRTIALLASNLAGGEISLCAQVSGIDNKSSLIASLGHIFEIVETPAGKVLGPIAENTAPQDYALSAYPNPFNPSTQIRFTMKEAGRATVRIYNLTGQLVRELLNEYRAVGEHTVLWDGRDHRGTTIASGVYFIRFEAGNEVKLSKVMLVR